MFLWELAEKKGFNEKVTLQREIKKGTCSFANKISFLIVCVEKERKGRSRETYVRATCRNEECDEEV